MNISKEKLNGIVYTPKWIVDLILDHIDYKSNICDRKIIDPACGDGAFLSEVVERFIADAKRKRLNKQNIKKVLEENIWGFDIDDKAIKRCIDILDEIVLKHGLKNIKWQIIKTNSLDKPFVDEYFNFFDFVVGNPPYIRIQHLGKERRKKNSK